MKKFHITWPTGKSAHDLPDDFPGRTISDCTTELLAGTTIYAETMREALVQFHQSFNVEPKYIIEL